MFGTELRTERGFGVRGSLVTAVRGFRACGGQAARSAMEDEAPADSVFHVWAGISRHKAEGGRESMAWKPRYHVLQGRLFVTERWSWCFDPSATQGGIWARALKASE